MSNPERQSGLEKPLKKRRRRWIVWGLASGLVLIVLTSARPVWHLVSALRQDTDGREPLPSGFTDDASRLNLTKVEEVVPVEGESAAAERQLARLLQQARAEGLRVSIAGTRHSMGGHTIYPGGLVIDMLPFNRMELDETQNVLHVQAGARWKDIIPYLDQRQYSVAVMQSDNTFSVGGSISVNCHGWQFGRPPISSTVESFRLMLADGRVVRCSRDENLELFSLALGGYGLFGIILDVKLQVVPNERYRLEQFVVPVDAALQAFERSVQDRPDVAMVYARMSIVPDTFLDEVILNVFYRDPAPDGTIPELSEPSLVDLRRALFRGSAGSDYGKGLRWDAETRLQPHLSERHFSRNQLLNEGSEIFQNRAAGFTDILQEYFVPRKNIEPLVVDLRRIIPKHGCDLLNVTVRSIDTDHDSFLRYADQPLFSLVLLFNQPRTPAGEAAMESLTQELIGAALAAGGRYYLPYRLHATPEQFYRAYPQAERFFELKREHDPAELFQNQFYVKYKVRR
ncbi:MAG: FAD-binding oxidoreductase [Planctomycetaceae bacterium]|nr:FAD-binding oxidoreductase [Planctomycetaceae bacterium]